MPLLLLVRHGENDYVRTGKLAGRLPGVHLNERGQIQSTELADSLSNLPIKAIYSSPMERALETASPLSSKVGLQVQICEGLVETSVGDWAGQELKTLRKQSDWKAVQENPSRFRFPGGESFLECQTRMVESVETILKGHSPEDILVCVSHADPIKLLSAYHLGMPLDHFQRLACEPASVTAFLFSPHGVMLVKLNQRAPFNFFLSPKKPKARK